MAGTFTNTTTQQITDTNTGFSTPSTATQQTAAASTTNSTINLTSGQYGNLQFPSDLASIDHWMQISIFAYSRANRLSGANRQNKGTITLPLPPSLRTAYNASYTPTEMGWVQETKAALTSAFKKFFNKPGDFSISDASPNMSAADIVKDQFSWAGAEALRDYIGGPGAQLDLGLARNPHLAALYIGNRFREHSFEWKFTIRNQSESDTLANIIKVLKYAQAPDIAPANNASGQNHLMTYPDECDVQFHYPTYLFYIGPSVFTSLDVEYHGTGHPAYFQNSHAPVEVHLSLRLMESTIVTKNSILNENR